MTFWDYALFGLWLTWLWSVGGLALVIWDAHAEVWAELREGGR